MQLYTIHIRTSLSTQPAVDGQLRLLPSQALSGSERDVLFAATADGRALARQCQSHAALAANECQLAGKSAIN